MSQSEYLTVVLYDIHHDRTRTKVSEKCLDYGLDRFQFSAFHGRLTKNRREELAVALEHLIEVQGGKISIIPICQADIAARVDIQISRPPIEQVPLRVYRDDIDNPAQT